MTRAAASVLALVAASCGLGDGDGRWVSVRRGELVIGVEVTGQLASTESHPVGPPAISDLWNFKLAFMADEGSHVEAGAPVVGFDASELQRQLEEYRNEAESAAKELGAHRASAKMAVRDGELAVEQALAAERKAKLKAQGTADVVAEAELERARLDLEFAHYASGVARRKVDAQSRQSRAEINRLERVQTRATQRVEQIQQSIAATQVPAPIAGTVLYVVDWQGNKKKIGDNAWRGEKIVEVVSLQHMKADGEIDEMDASRIAVGQSTRIRLDANADIELVGKVVKIEDAVQRRSPEDPLKVVKLEIELAKTPDVELRPGMRFRGAVETEKVSDVLIVPLDAVFATPEGAFVYKKVGRTAEPTAVTLGRRGSDRVEVLSGLAQGDEVALMDAERKDEERSEMTGTGPGR